MKKRLIVSLMLLSLLTLAACGTTQGDTTDTADTADSSQTAADTTQDAQDNAQNDAQGDTQENAQNDTQEGSKNDGKIDSKTDGKIKPLPDALDLNRLTSGTVAASFDASSLKEVDGQLQLSFTVYNYEKFDAADISGLKAGDVLVVSGREMTVVSVQASDGYVTVNGGEEAGGVLFSLDASSNTYYVMGMDDSKTLLIGGLCCGLALGVASCLQQVGMQYTTVGKAGFITAMYIVIVPILGLFFHKKVGVKLWISVVVAMFGLYLLCMSGSLQLQKGDLLVLLCALAFSGHIMVIDHFSPKVDGVQMSCIQFFVASLFSMVCMLGAEGVPVAGDVFQSWAPILYAGILSSGVGYTLQIVGQKGVNPTIASLILSLESVMSVLAGWLFLHQGMSGREILGCVLMFVAIILAQLPERKKAEKQTA